jgi:hypothetical protein
LADVAGSSAMPGWPISPSGHTWPDRLAESMDPRGGESRGVGYIDHSFGLLPPMTFSLVRISSATFIGGLGRALLVRKGGLTRRGVVEPATWALVMTFSFSSELALGLRVHNDL